MKFKRVIIHPYSFGSKGAKDVAAHLTTMDVTCLRVRADGEYIPKDGDFIMMWGAGNAPSWYHDTKKVECEVLNPPQAICKSVDKITAFRCFGKADVPVPPWTENESTALKWSKDGKWVCCRTSTEGMDGRGLVLAKKPDEMQWAPLFTQFVPNEREFRVYVFDDEVLDVLEKKADDEATDPYIRTETNHYIYLRQGTNVPGIKEAAKAATKALGLRFAGVDVIYGEDHKPYVLETNTAPGIGQITAQRIARAIKEAAGL